MRRPSGTCEIPRATRRSARSAGDVGAVEPDPARARPEQAAHGAQQRRLARAVRADQRRRSRPRCTSKSTAAQRDGSRRRRPTSDSTRSSGARALMRAPLVVGAQVGLDHARVAAHLLGRALGDLLAVVEHGDALAQVHHERDVVIDQHDGELELAVQLTRSARAAPPSPRDSCRRPARRAAAGAAASRARARSRAGAARRRAASRRARPRSAPRPRRSSSARACASLRGLAVAATRRRAARRRATSGARRPAPRARSRARVSERNRRMFWNVRAMPRRQIWCGGRPSMRSPSNAHAALGRRRRRR